MSWKGWEDSTLLTVKVIGGEARIYIGNTTMWVGNARGAYKLAQALEHLAVGLWPEQFERIESKEPTSPEPPIIEGCEPAPVYSPAPAP